MPFCGMRNPRKAKGKLHYCRGQKRKQQEIRVPAELALGFGVIPRYS
jgi:hypothetical protein